MDGTALDHLVDFIGALRTSSVGDSVHATVLEESPTQGIHRKYLVEARTFEGTFEYRCQEAAAESMVKYMPHTRQLIWTEPGQESEARPIERFPSFLPVLTMFSPLNLPIWGGYTDSRRCVSVIREGEGRLRLEFVAKDQGGNSDMAGHAVIDLHLGIAVEMLLGDSLYTTHDVRAFPPMYWLNGS